MKYLIGDIATTLESEANLPLNTIGYLSLLSFSVAGWAADNAEVRRLLYRTLKGLLMGARQLLAEVGVIKVELTGSHKEDTESYGMLMYSAEFNLRTWVVSRVTFPRGATIEDIDIAHTLSQAVSV